MDRESSETEERIDGANREQERPAGSTTRPNSLFLRIYVLGPLRIEWVGQVAPFPTERLQGRGAAPSLGLLKALLSQPDRFALRDWLMEQFWPESARSKAEERLDDVASGLRSLLRPPGSQAKILHFVYGSNGRGSGYRLEGYPQIWVDADAFVWYVEHAALMDRFGQDSLSFWEQAYTLASRGIFLPEESYSDWAQPRREVLEGYYRQCTHRLAHLLREAGAYEEAMIRLRCYWQQHPGDEDALRPLLELLGALERYQEAEQYYQQAREALQQEGREPDHRTQDVIEYVRTRPLQRERSEHRLAIPTPISSPPIIADATYFSSHEDEQDATTPSNTAAFSQPPLAETRHLIGREEWLATVLQMVQAIPPKKLIVLQGPIGVGKSSELNRLARHCMSLDHGLYHVLWLPMLSVEQIGGPEAALDVFLGTLLNEHVPFPADASRQTLISLALAFLERQTSPTVILLDNAECLLTEGGMLSLCWEAFLTQFLRCHHPATLILATKEWRGWSGRDGIFVAEVTVPPLTLQESVCLLQRLGLETVPVEHLRRMSERVACIPLCLEWSAKLVCDPLLLDDWLGMESEDETQEQGNLDSVTQRVLRLLEEPSLLGGHLATQLAPLLQQIIEKHLSNEARCVLERLAISSIPLGKPAMQMLCPRPGLLKELRDASLLAAYTHRVQLLPMVASTVRQCILPDHLHEMEKLVIQAYTHWLDEENMSDREAGSVVTELAVLLLTHRRLLDAAQLLIRYGWLSFKLGTAPRMAHLAEEIMQQFDWHMSFDVECGGKLLYYFLTPYLGKKFDMWQYIQDYQIIRDAAFADKIALNPHTEIFLTHHLMVEEMDELRFAEAQILLDSCYNHLRPLHESDFGVKAALLEKQGMLLSRQCEYADEQGEKQQSRELRKQAIAIYQQSSQMLARYNEPSLLKRSCIKKWQVHALNYLGYHLYRMSRYEEALQALQQCIDLQEQGYGGRAGLPPCYGDTSQTLAALGRFQEALLFDEKAYTEAQHLADLGHTSSRDEVWIYRVNRGCLYLRLGRIDEAEQLLREAEPHIARHRRMYRMFAKKALEEIEQWRRTTTLPQHQLDWRWVERYRTLASFDSYWWLAPAGPFTDEEQREWEQSFTYHLDEATKERLGTLMSHSTRREVLAALEEQREPCLRYPALNIGEVCTRITRLLELDAEILQDEPNAIVRRLYHDTIGEELDFLRLIEATYEGNSEHFWEYNLRLNTPATPEEMRYALLCVRHNLVQGLLRNETKWASERLIQVLREQCGISLDLSAPEEEMRNLLSDIPSISSPSEPKVSAQAAKRFFEATLREAGFDGWQVVIDPNAGSARVEQGLRCLFLEDRSLSVKYIKHLLSHELAGHVARCVAGERSLLGLLGIHTKNSLETEEGLTSYYEAQEEMLEGKGHPETVFWPGTLATGFACGVISPPQTFRSLFTIFEALYFLRRLLRQLDPDEETARKKARQFAIMRCLRTFRGVPDLTRAGICYTKDAHYLRGLCKIEDALKKDEHVLDRLAVGVVAIDRLPDLQELGIVNAPQPLRMLAEDPQLDEHILSFEQAEENIN